MTHDEEKVELKQECPRCKGTGFTEEIGFASAGHMDSGSDPAPIKKNCYLCRGEGFYYPPAEELVEKLLSALGEVERLTLQFEKHKEAVTEAALRLGLAVKDDGWFNEKANHLEAELAELKQRTERERERLGRVALRLSTSCPCGAREIRDFMPTPPSVEREEIA